MSGNPTEQYNHALGYNSDPRLAEWSQIQLAPIRVDHSQDHQQGPLPYISPYSTDIYPKHTSPFDAQTRDTTGHSPYEGPQHAYMFHNDEHIQSYTSSPIDSSNDEQSPPPIELQLKQSTGDAVAEYQAKLIAVNGVVIPSRNAPNVGSPKPSGTSSSTDPSANHTCPICGAGYGQKYEVACHFVACVDQHGNPHGACWDDYSSITGQTTTSQEPEQATNQTAPPRQPPQTIKPIPTPTQGPRYESARKKTFNDRLNAVNGVVIPLKVPARTIIPSQTTRSPSSTILLQLSCPICKSPFGKRDYVRSHFATCVKRNGNPDGLRWDDGLPKLRRGPRGKYFGGG